MAKPYVKRVHADELEWQAPPGGVPGVGIKLLNVDPETGAAVRLMTLPPEWRKSGRGAAYHECAEEVYVLQGEVILDDTHTYTQGCYFYRPAGIVHGDIERTESGCVMLSFSGGKMTWHFPETFPGGRYPGEYPIREISDGRGHVSFLDTNRMEWGELANAYRPNSGLMQKTLSVDNITDASTVLVRVPAGFQGTGTHFHECLEEFFVVEGSITLSDVVYPSGSYACHPAFLVHGTGERSDEGGVALMRRDGAFRLYRPDDASEQQHDKLRCT